MRNRPAVGAVGLSLLVSAGLTARIVSIDKPAVFVILVPSLVGVALAIRSRGRVALGVAALLTVLTGAPLLIGGEGLLYLPSVVLYVWGAASPERRAAPGHG